jgi:Rps23 Pro-64 3,4-dihydroxylase Tpa1-like proline 4-hydroxylase
MGVGFDARNLSIEKQTPIGARLMREPSKPNVSRMAAWRRSLQDDFSKQKPLSDVALAQAELMEQQRRAQMTRYQRIQASENLHNSIAERMRRGDMQDLHRDAMRRMQATANRKAMSP